MRCVIGVDGGGTKTEAVLVDEEGSVLHKATVGATNPYAVSPEIVAENFRELFKQLLSMDGITEIVAVGLGLSGVATTEEQSRMSERLNRIGSELGMNSTFHLYHDAEIALSSSCGKSQGVVAIAGTGSIVFGMTTDGKKLRVGGWGHVLGDEGSGYAVGLASLRTIMKSYDGQIGPTQLTSMVLAHLGLREALELKARVYETGMTKSEIAAVAAICAQAADHGDAAANAILAEAGAALADQADTLIRREPPLGELTLVMVGSLFQRCRRFTEAFSQPLEARYPLLELRLGETAPAYGAAMLALQQGRASG